jgi:HlyD family secretion protein
MNSDLKSLSHQNDAQIPTSRFPAWIIPSAIVAGFFLIFFALFRDRILPAKNVDVAVVLTTPSLVAPAESANENQKPSTPGKMLFQASGWIEPDPLPIRATALTDGVVDSVHVLEGQTVEKGQLLATLISDDARLSLKSAEQQHRTRVSSRASHLASIETVRKTLISAQAAIHAAQTLEEEANDQYQRLERLPHDAISQQDVVSARLRLAREKARRSMTQTDADEIIADIERLQLETAVKDDQIEAAAIEVEKAKLALERTRILSPIEGRILRRVATPGQKRMLAMDDPESSTIAILYHPEKLQARVDVPLADAAGLSIAQQVFIHCGLLPEKVFHGIVSRITGEADLQRNTLQAKVQILDPVESLRPEMLCRAEFLAPAAAPGSSLSSGSPNASLATWIPEAAIAGGNVWICDPKTKRVTARPIETTDEIQENYQRITGTIRPGEWVVITPVGLRNGQRVNAKLIQP